RSPSPPAVGAADPPDASSAPASCKPGAACATLTSCCERLEAGRPPTAASASRCGEALGGCALMICWHFGQRTLNGRAGTLALSSCRRVVQFGQVTIIILK